VFAHLKAAAEERARVAAKECQTRLTYCTAMDIPRFWTLIDQARRQVTAEAGGDEVASRTSTLLAAYPRADIVAAQQVIWDLMAASYRNPLWAAAYLVNDGCSDDGFDYFRGWLITQGRAAFEQAVANPEALADLPAFRAAAAGGEGAECEAALAIAWHAHRAATGEDLPPGAFTVRYPELDPAWDFDFDDDAEMRRRLPRLSALCRE
jgi:Protein of unknown function (DUF4240)